MEVKKGIVGPLRALGVKMGIWGSRRVLWGH